MELSENLKLHLDAQPGEAQQDRSARHAEHQATTLTAEAGSALAGPNLIDDAESQMRKALGLLGETSRHRPDSDRGEQLSRLGDRFNGGLHRRRFVQDGDIPVTVLRRDQPHEAPAHRGVAAAPPPTSSRLQRTEAALAAETAARDKAERLLAETQNIVRDLRTKIGHAELAKNEAVEALRHERESIAQIRAEGDAWKQQLHDALEQARAAERNAHLYQEHLAEERQARKLAEKSLRTAEVARDIAEQLVRTLSEEAAAPRRPAVVDSPRRQPEAVTNAAGRARQPEVPPVEPEPVKWWLNIKSGPKKR